MKRASITLTVCLFCLLCASVTLAEELTISSASGGYSITLPEGWAPMAPAALEKSGAVDSEALPEKAKAQLMSTLQGAIYFTSDYGLVVTLVIHHAENSAMGITPADTATITAPGNPVAEKIRKEVEDSLAKADVTFSPAKNPPDGLAMALDLNAGGTGRYGIRPQLCGITQVRFTTDNVILVSVLLMAKDAPDRKKEAQAILDRLIIGPEKSLASAAGKNADVVTPDKQ